MSAKLHINSDTIRRLLVEADQQTFETLATKDPVTVKAQRGLRDNFTSGVVSTPMFHRIYRWQINACLRRAGLTLPVAHRIVRSVCRGAK
jgi:hypothetical protein